jgi:hypothetical protein
VPRRALPLLLALAAVALNGCGGGSDVETSATGGAAVTELASVDQLATAFDADKGKARLVLLLSPT